MSFYEYMISRYGKEKSDRGALARRMGELAEEYPQVARIDSFHDLVSLACEPEKIDLPSNAIGSSEAFQGVGDSLWAEYCAACNHPL